MPSTKTPQARKRPRQARSRATVDALLDATARVLVKRGYAAASTNRIAETAGISIGSLYQYFPSKDALIGALRQRHAEEMSRLLKTQAAVAVGAPLPDAVRMLVHALVQAHLIDPQLHRVLGEQIPRAVALTDRADIGNEILETLRYLLSAYKDQILPTDIGMASLVLLHTVEALIHAVIFEPKPDVSIEAIEKEIQVIVLRYLTGAVS